MATSTRPSKNGNYGPFGPDQQAFQSLPHPGRHSLKPTHERPAVLTQSPLHQSPAIFCRPARARPLAPPRDATRLPSRRPHRRPSATRDATHAATRPAANFSAAPSPRAVPCSCSAFILGDADARASAANAQPPRAAIGTGSVRVRRTARVRRCSVV